MSRFFLLVNSECVFVSRPDKHIKDLGLNKIKQNFEPTSSFICRGNFWMDSFQHYKHKWLWQNLLIQTQYCRNNLINLFCNERTAFCGLDVTFTILPRFWNLKLWYSLGQLLATFGNSYWTEVQSSLSSYPCSSLTHSLDVVET